MSGVPQVSIVIPWRPPDRTLSQTPAEWAQEPRVRAFQYVSERWIGLHPEWQRIVVDADASPGVPFSRAASINAGVEQSRSPVIVVADADVIVDPALIREAAVHAARQPGIVFPFDRYYPLSEAATARIYSGETDLAGIAASHMPQLCVSGCFAISREAFQEVRFDERFAGWGHEDIAFECACYTLLGPTRRMTGGVAGHLWHDPAERGPDRNYEMGQRYQKARGYPREMWKVLKEARHEPSRT